jgi:hypothetical protein
MGKAQLLGVVCVHTEQQHVVRLCAYMPNQRSGIGGDGEPAIRRRDAARTRLVPLLPGPGAPGEGNAAARKRLYWWWWCGM